MSRYNIYYMYVANGVPSTSGGSTASTSYVLTNLQVGIQYNISVIAVGTYMPSTGATITVLKGSIPALVVSKQQPPVIGKPNGM